MFFFIGRIWIWYTCTFPSILTTTPTDSLGSSFSTTLFPASKQSRVSVSGSGFPIRVWPISDPGLCTSNKGRFQKVYVMNIFDNFKASFFCSHTSSSHTIIIGTSDIKSLNTKKKVFRILKITLRSRYRPLDPKLPKKSDPNR